MAYGTVDSLDRMAEYLRDVAEGREPSPELVAEMRYRYEKVGGSPLLRITFEQARALERELERRGDPRSVYVGMRHSEPRIQGAVEAMMRDGVQDMVAIVMAPHYSTVSVARYRQRLLEALQRWTPAPRVRWVDSWWNTPALQHALGRRIRCALDSPPLKHLRRVRVIFTAHSLPLRRIAADEPYEKEIRSHAQQLADGLGLTDWTVAFQSQGTAAVGPWMGPTLSETMGQARAQSIEGLLVAPIGFVCDHVEVLYDLDIAARHDAERLGLVFERTKSLNADEDFIGALADVVQGQGSTLE